jgi:hypothetical protein
VEVRGGIGLRLPSRIGPYVLHHAVLLGDPLCQDPEDTKSYESPQFRAGKCENVEGVEGFQPRRPRMARELRPLSTLTSQRASS